MALIVNLYATVKTLPPLGFSHRLLHRRDRTDPELADHLNGFIGFIMDGGKRQMTRTLYGVMRHIQRVQHHLSIEVEEADTAQMGRWAEEANAIAFLQDSTVRDPRARVLVDPVAGEAEPEAVVPHPKDAWERKERTQAVIGAKGLSVPASLPPVLGAGEVEFRPAPEIAKRALALLAVAIRAESVGQGNPMSADEIGKRLAKGLDALTDAERGFIDDDSPERQAVVNFVWRYEALWLLEWALGLVDELPWPTAICDVAKAASVLLDTDHDALLATARVRSPEEILDALDLCFRLHWITREARRTKAECPGKLEPGVLQERHYALNWLVRFQDASWDDVDTPT